MGAGGVIGVPKSLRKERTEKRGKLYRCFHSHLIISFSVNTQPAMVLGCFAPNPGKISI